MSQLAGAHVPEAPAFAPVTTKSTCCPLRGVPSGFVTVAVTACVVPTGFVAVVGSRTMFGATTTIPVPATRMYASPHTAAPVSTSVPHVGLVGVSVAIARADQSVGKVGKDSWTEQLQPWRSLVECGELGGVRDQRNAATAGWDRVLRPVRRIDRQQRQQELLPVTHAVRVVVRVAAAEVQVQAARTILDAGEFDGRVDQLLSPRPWWNIGSVPIRIRLPTLVFPPPAMTASASAVAFWLTAWGRKEQLGSPMMMSW